MLRKIVFGSSLLLVSGLALAEDNKAMADAINNKDAVKTEMASENTERSEINANEFDENDELEESEARSEWTEQERKIHEHIDANKDNTPEDAKFAFDEDKFFAVVPLTGMNSDRIRITSDVPGVLTLKFLKADSADAANDKADAADALDADALSNAKEADYEVHLESFGARPEDVLAEVVKSENVLVVSVRTKHEVARDPNAVSFDEKAIPIHFRANLEDLAAMNDDASWAFKTEENLNVEEISAKAADKKDEL